MSEHAPESSASPSFWAPLGGAASGADPGDGTPTQASALETHDERTAAPARNGASLSKDVVFGASTLGVGPMTKPAKTSAPATGKKKKAKKAGKGKGPKVTSWQGRHVTIEVDTPILDVEANVSTTEIVPAGTEAVVTEDPLDGFLKIAYDSGTESSVPSEVWIERADVRVHEPEPSTPRTWLDRWVELIEDANIESGPGPTADVPTETLPRTTRGYVIATDGPLILIELDGGAPAIAWVRHASARIVDNRQQLDMGGGTKVSTYAPSYLHRNVEVVRDAPIIEPNLPFTPVVEDSARVAAGTRGTVIDVDSFGAILVAYGSSELGTEQAWVEPPYVRVLENRHGFAHDFKLEFHEILDVAFGGAHAVTDESLATLFSPWQRQQLTEFFFKKLIPEGLFNDSRATGAATPQQRTLMAGHILTFGKFQPTSADGTPRGAAAKPRGDNCGHWAGWVWNYAGVHADDGPAIVDFAVQGPTGQTVLGGGQIQGGDAYFKGAPLSEEVLPREGKHAQAAKEAAEKGKTVAGRTTYLDYQKDITSNTAPPEQHDTFTLPRPGDWLYIYNANPSGQHSIIFAGWAKADEAPTQVEADGVTVTYKEAWVFDQPSPERGGTYHRLKLGHPYHPGLGVKPITLMQRPDPNLGPPRSVEQLLVFDRVDAGNKNLDVITKHRLDLTLLRDALDDTVRRLLGEELYQNFEPAQKEMCNQVLAQCSGADIESITLLVALGEKLWLHAQSVKGTLEVISGKVVVNRQGDSARLACGTVASLVRKSEAESSDVISYDATLAIERNRLSVRRLGCDVPMLVAALEAGARAALEREQAATGKRKNAPSPAAVTRAAELIAAHGTGTELGDVAALVAAWQALHSKRVTGWASTYDEMASGDLLAAAKIRPASTAPVDALPEQSPATTDVGDACSDGCSSP